MKKFTTIICTLAMLASLTACSSNEVTSGEPVDDKQIVVNAPADSGDKTPESAPEDISADNVTDEKNSGNTDSKPDAEPSGETGETSAPDESNSTENTDKDNTENKTENKNEQTNAPETDAALPLKQYPDGSYFTYDGKPCTDHDQCSWEVDCNCVNFDRAIQSMGFAKYVYFQVTGEHVSLDDKINVDADITAETAKSTLMDAQLGTYIAVTQSNDVPHFMTVVDTDENGITVYQANYGGGCVVRVSDYSWDDFAARFPHLDYYVK